MDKSNVEDHLKFEEFFEGRYQAKRVILSRYNYKLYEAVDTSQLNSRVFIKQLLTQKPASQSELSLHYDTIKSLQDLDSPNLFKIVNSEVKETECLLIMESFDGLNLEDYSETGPGSSSLLLVFFQVILALNELHQKSVLHINLRPDNIFVGIDGLVKIGGVSLLRSSNYSNSTRSFFNPTPGYSAPEVWESGVILDETADVYSLGSLLFFCVTEGEHPTRILSSSKIPAKFRSIIQKSRQVCTTERYASVRLFEDALLSLLSSDYVSPQIEDLDKTELGASFSEDSPSEDETLDKQLSKPKKQPSKQKSKNIMKKLGAPFQSITADFKEAWHDAKQEILQETRDLVRNKLLKSKNEAANSTLTGDDSKSTGDEKSNTFNKIKGIIADAKRLKELRKKEKQNLGSSSSTKENQLITETKTNQKSTPSTDSSDQVIKEKIQLKQSSSSSLNLDFLKLWMEQINSILNPNIFSFLGIFLVLFLVVLFMRDGKFDEQSPSDLASKFTKQPNIKIMGNAFWRNDEISDWEPLKTVNSFKSLSYLHAPEGDVQLLDHELDFRLEMKKGCKLRLLHIKGSKNGLKNRVELEIGEGEFVVHSKSSHLFLEIVDENVRVYGRGVIFKVKGNSGNSSYFVKKGSLSIQLPSRRKLERISPGRMFKISKGKIERKSRFDINLEDF